MGTHYYTEKGQKVYQVFSASKTAKNPTRNTSMRDAKKWGLLPSVSNIKGQLDKPQLEIWKNEQLTTAVYNDFMQSELGQAAINMDYQSFHDKAVTEMHSVSRGYADLGTAVHNALEQFLKGEEYPEEMKPWIDRFFKIVSETYPDIAFVSLEAPFGSRFLGYAGCLDIIGYLKESKRYVLLDTKTKTTKPKTKIVVYEEYRMQLAAYKRGFIAPSNISDYTIAEGNKYINPGFQFPASTIIANVFLSSTESDRQEIIELTQDEENNHWSMFRMLRDLYFLRNKWDPRVDECTFEEKDNATNA